MGLGRINPQERDWRDNAMEWLESASDQEIIDCYQEEIAYQTSPWHSPWHLEQITSEMVRRNLLEDRA